METSTKNRIFFKIQRSIKEKKFTHNVTTYMETLLALIFLIFKIHTLLNSDMLCLVTLL